MKRWVVSVNDIYKEGHVTREEGSRLWFFLEWAADVFCDLLHKLPNIPTGKVDEDDIPYETYQEWWCMQVHNQIMIWLHRKYKITGAKIDLDDLPTEWYIFSTNQAFSDFLEEDPFSDSRPEVKEKYALFILHRKMERGYQESRLKAKAAVIKEICQGEGWSDQ